ncbi:2-dehydro-3-deoxygluconokinase [Bacillus sp. FJAT-18017]|uniref:sugar kinase n=1 Tax=Bacillus sp. FJAT-18017 TaxID=1705566 RepID=UPI0006ADB009|nr:sugar kinase [Bacillus sp. FJAT-18017]ALC89428.1 2-dehydro-3-deoxygluconokinase [Bacillus sp. FJAT-18017]
MDVISLGESMVLFTPDTNGLMRYAHSFSSKIAGAETNTLIGLSRLGHQTGWISRVGNDEFGEKVLSAVRGEGVHTGEVRKDSEAPTGIYFKELVNETATRIHYYRKGSAASRLTPADISEDYIMSARYLYITGITPALSESCEVAIFHSIEVAKKHGVKVVFDPNIRRKLWGEEKARRTLLAIAEEADIVLPGIGEGEFLFGSTDYSEIASHFHQLGASIVVVKLGADGAYYSTDSDCGVVEGFKVKQVIDPVGAGDGFAAGFLSGLLDDIGLADAVKRGNAIGAIVTTVNGDIEGLPNRELLAGFLASSEDVAR